MGLVGLSCRGVWLRVAAGRRRGAERCCVQEPAPPYDSGGLRALSAPPRRSPPSGSSRTVCSSGRHGARGCPGTVAPAGQGCGKGRGGASAAGLAQPRGRGRRHVRLLCVPVRGQVCGRSLPSWLLYLETCGGQGLTVRGCSPHGGQGCGLVGGGSACGPAWLQRGPLRAGSTAGADGTRPGPPEVPAVSAPRGRLLRRRRRSGRSSEGGQAPGISSSGGFQDWPQGPSRSGQLSPGAGRTVAQVRIPEHSRMLFLREFLCRPGGPAFPLASCARRQRRRRRPQAAGCARRPRSKRGAARPGGGDRAARPRPRRRRRLTSEPWQVTAVQEMAQKVPSRFRGNRVFLLVPPEPLPALEPEIAHSF